MTIYWTMWAPTNFKRICKVVTWTCMYFIFLIFIYFFLLLLKLLQLHWLAVICLHIKVTGVFWEKANSLETDNIWTFFIWFFWRLLLTCCISRSYCRLCVFTRCYLLSIFFGGMSVYICCCSLFMLFSVHELPGG
jgi:hypothetical protein